MSSTLLKEKNQDTRNLTSLKEAKKKWLSQGAITLCSKIKKTDMYKDAICFDSGDTGRGKH